MNFQLFSAECLLNHQFQNIWQVVYLNAKFKRNVVLRAPHCAGPRLVERQAVSSERECVCATPRAVIQQQAGKLKQDESRRAAGVKISGRHKM